MRRKILIITITLLISSTISFAQEARNFVQETTNTTQQARDITLQTTNIEECYTLAKENYPEIKRYNLLEKLEEYNISNALKSWLPQLSINAKASYQSDVTTIPLNELNIPGLDFPSLSKDQYQVRAQVTQKIWDGGKTKAQREIIESENNVAKSSVTATLYTLKERVNQLYFGCLLQKEILKQNATLKAELNSKIKEIDALINSGVANLTNRKELEVELLQAEQQRIEINSALSSYCQMLSLITGKELTPECEFTTPKEYKNLVESSPINKSKAPNANINRPELEIFNAQKELLNAQENSIRSYKVPELGLFIDGGYGRPGLDMLNNSFKPFYIVGAKISWSIGNIYTEKNHRAIIENSRKEIEVQRENFLYNLRLEMANKQSNIVKLKELANKDSEIAELRTSIKKATQIKLENGTATTSDLISSINAESIAKQRVATRKIELLAAIYNYIYTTNN